MMNFDAIIIGAGPAGMMASITAAKEGKKVLLIEKNEKCGKKLFITGKGRCNITNACDVEELFPAVVSNSRFLYSAFYTYTNEDVIQFFNEAGCKTKIERGNRVFPVSDKSSDVIGALKRKMNQYGVSIKYDTTVKKIWMEDQAVKGVVLLSGEKIQAQNVIVATGGMSYASTGSTGDGYQFAKEAGHTVTALRPALVPIETEEEDCKEMMGLSLRNVQVRATVGKKKIFEEFGELLFTHFGVSGPVILSLSSHLTGKEKDRVKISIDLKPALSAEKLDQRIIRDFDENKNKQFSNGLDSLLPKKMIPVMIKRSGIDPHKKINEITKAERANLVDCMKNFTIYVKGVRDFKEAIITKGGVKVKEINPATMESKLVSGLYFIGEVLDLDAVTGGYNLQIAWSSAYLAGKHVVEK